MLLLDTGGIARFDETVVTGETPMLLYTSALQKRGEIPFFNRYFVKNNGYLMLNCFFASAYYLATADNRLNI